MDEPAALLRALHDRHAPELWRYVMRLTGDDRFAEDVVQETLLRAWRRPQILREDEPAARAWLYTVARNLVIDHQRSARSRRELTSDDVPERATEDATIAVLDEWLVTDSLAQLSAEHRVVLVHAYYGRRSVADIAAELGIPAGTVKSRLHYGLRALRLALQEKGVTSQ
ncbi:MAG TPA: sigma-70 family RNA polymerase sigma factor [Kribbellaceae bacterium]